MSEPFKVDGVDYSPAGIEDLRQELIRFRGEAMSQNAWHPVVTLSHTIALLAYLGELVAAVAKHRAEVLEAPTADLPAVPVVAGWLKVSAAATSPCLRRDVPLDHCFVCDRCGWTSGRHVHWPGVRTL